MEKILNRRDFLKYAGLGAATLVISGCTNWSSSRR